MRMVGVMAMFVASLVISGCNGFSVKSDNNVDRLIGTKSSGGGSPKARAVSGANGMSRDEIAVNLGLGYLREGKYKLAAQKLNQALAMNSNRADANAYLGVLYNSIGEPGKAGKYFRRSVELAPSNSDFRNNYGSYLCQEGELDKAIKQFDAAARDRLYAQPEVPLTNAGLCLKDHNNFTEAEVYLRQALMKNQEHGLALYEMASLSYQDGDFESASHFIKRYHNSAKANAASLFLGFKIGNELGDRDMSAKYATLLKGRFPDAMEIIEMKNMLETKAN